MTANRQTDRRDGLITDRTAFTAHVGFDASFFSRRVFMYFRSFVAFSKNAAIRIADVVKYYYCLVGDPNRECHSIHYVISDQPDVHDSNIIMCMRACNPSKVFGHNNGNNIIITFSVVNYFHDDRMTVIRRVVSHAIVVHV